jgi:hypothetical protein
MQITAYFKYPSLVATQNALVIIPELRSCNTTFALITSWGTNHNPKVVEITFFNPAGTDPHPYEFPYFTDLDGVARTTGAIKVYRKYHEIWPNKTSQI